MWCLVSSKLTPWRQRIGTQEREVGMEIYPAFAGSSMGAEGNQTDKSKPDSYMSYRQIQLKPKLLIIFQSANSVWK
jgi:hypothetical protein